MHVAFIPYGKRECVNLMLDDMAAQKHRLKMWKGDKETTIWIQGQVRFMPFGVYEYVFPKEDLDAVLTTLKFKGNVYTLGEFKLAPIRMMIKCKKFPKDYKEKKRFLWITDNVSIIPIGIREEGDFTDPQGEYEGWTHEAI